MSPDKKAKKPHLGRGLESLLGPINTPQPPLQANQTSPQSPHFPPDKDRQDAVEHIHRASVEHRQ